MKYIRLRHLLRTTRVTVLSASLLRETKTLRKIIKRVKEQKLIRPKGRIAKVYLEVNDDDSIDVYFFIEEDNKSRKILAGHHTILKIREAVNDN